MGEFTGERLEWDGPFKVVDCSRALAPSGLPEMDYALNPYGGCEHGCIYCYAPGHTHSDPATWRVVKVKRNIADRLVRELPFTEGVIGIGSVTDPYQAAERRFLLTRRCLEVLSSKGRSIHIHTKSDLILRDLDILTGMDCVVGMTITTTDERISKITEPGAPLPEARLRALAELVDSGIRSYALVAPVMSTLEGREAELADALRTAGIEYVFYDHLNLRLVDPSRLERMGIRPSPKAEREFREQCMLRGLDTVSDRPLRSDWVLWPRRW